MLAERKTVLEICAGAGGQSLGLDRAGFAHIGAVEIDKDAAATLRLNRPKWDVVEGDVRSVDASSYEGVTLFAGGVPCPPFSVAGKRLGKDDERDLFPEAIQMIRQAKPAAIMLENVKGLAAARFDSYRHAIRREIEDMGYVTDWQLVHASSFGVPQLRPRFILIGLKPRAFSKFHWPVEVGPAPTVGATLKDLMAARGWTGADGWAERAREIAPTIVGGSKKHGGADLGPTRSKRAWRELGVDGLGIADLAPGTEAALDHMPRLTNPMVARLQGFPDDWHFSGRKTSTYRQIGNAFPPPVAEAIGRSLIAALDGKGASRPRATRQGELPLALAV